MEKSETNEGYDMNLFIPINKVLTRFNLVLIPNNEYDELINMDLEHMDCSSRLEWSDLD